MFQWHSITNCLLLWHKRNPEQRLESQVTASSFGNIKLKHLSESNKLARMIMSHIQTNYEVISNGYVRRKLAGQLSICFSCFQSSSWWCPGEDCPIHVTCETASCSSWVHISIVSLKQTIGCWLSLKQYIKEILSKFGIFSCTEFYTFLFLA